MSQLGKPELTQDQAARLAKELYGVDRVQSMKEFPAYDDRNFYMKTEAGALYLLISLPASFSSSATGSRGALCPLEARRRFHPAISCALVSAAGEQYVMKVTNTVDSQNTEEIEVLGQTNWAACSSACQLAAGCDDAVRDVDNHIGDAVVW